MKTLRIVFGISIILFTYACIFYFASREVDIALFVKSLGVTALMVTLLGAGVWFAVPKP